MKKEKIQVTEDLFEIVKCMLTAKKPHSEISKRVKVSGSTVSRIANSADYADYRAAGYARTSKMHEKEKAQKQAKQVDMADLIPEEQPEPTHESLNRDMLKAILQSMQVLAANQSIIASKLDALIQKWE